MRAQSDARDDAETAAAAFQRPEKIGICATVGDFHIAVGGDDLRLQQASACLPVGFRPAAKAAAQNKADDPDRHAAAALHIAATLGRNSITGLSPVRAGFDRYRSLRLRASRAARAHERIVHRHGVHVARPDEKRVGGVGGSLIAVAAAFHHETQIVFPRKIDRGDDIPRRFGGDGVDARLRRPSFDPTERLSESHFVPKVVRALELLKQLLTSGVRRSTHAVCKRRAHLDEARLHVAIELIPARF